MKDIKTARGFFYRVGKYILIREWQDYRNYAILHSLCFESFTENLMGRIGNLWYNGKEMRPEKNLVIIFGNK